MPITFDIDHERRLVVAKPHGLLKDVEMFSYQRELGARSDARGYNELIDMSGVTEIEFISANRVSELAEYSSQMDEPDPPTKLAIVVINDYQYGLGRMYQTFREMAGQSTKNVGVFRSRQEALNWLELKVPSADPG